MRPCVRHQKGEGPLTRATAYQLNLVNPMDPERSPGGHDAEPSHASGRQEGLWAARLWGVPCWSPGLHSEGWDPGEIRCQSLHGCSPEGLYLAAMIHRATVPNRGELSGQRTLAGRHERGAWGLLASMAAVSPRVQYALVARCPRRIYI